MFIEIILLVVVALLSYQYLGKRRKPQHFPPGPMNYPFLGSIPALLGKISFHEKVFQLSKKHGSVVGLFLGPTVKCVAINGYEAVKQVLSREDFAFRPDGILLRARSFNKRLGVLFSDGPLWKEQRRFTLRHLRDFGFGKRGMEGLIHEEIATLMDNLNKRMAECKNMNSDGILIKDLFPVSVINILWAIMAGVRYDHNNEDFKTLMFNVNEFFRNGSPTGGIMAMPWLRFVPIVNEPYKKQLVSVDVLQKFIQNTIEDHKNTYQEDNMRDFLDVFIRELKAQENDPLSTYTQEQLVVLCMDLFLAGTETTASTLGYFFLYLMLHPREQEKMRQEIFKVVGRDRVPSLEDMSRLHYVQAASWEILRIANLLPFTVPHFTKDKIDLLGYTIPRNCLVIVNLYSVMMEEHWGDPRVFRPERFIKDGVCVKDERLILFGLGPRVCLGEPLAKNTSFLFLVSLLQKYRFSLPANHKEPNMEHLQGFTSSPQPYRVCVTSV